MTPDRKFLGFDRVEDSANYVWDDPELARQWMDRPHPELGGRTPRSVAATPDGALEINELLAKLFYGLPV